MGSKAMGTLLGLAAVGKLAMLALDRRRARALTGSTAVVCGASRGLGRAVALELARRGAAKIGLCARHERDLEDLAAALVRQGVEVCAERCDLSRSDDVERFFGDVAERLGPVDVLVANASTITVGPVALATKADFDEALASIFYTALNPILAVMPSMRRRRQGTIALVTSIGARIGVPHLGPYCAAKAAVLGLAESLRAELAADGVNVLAVVPGLMRTGSHLHAEFKGDHPREYAWFGASATAPLLSIDADRAARRIVSAITRGKVELSYTPESRLAPALRTLAPTLWAEAMALAARLLPTPPADLEDARERREGVAIEGASDSTRVQAVKARGRPFAERFGQLGHRA
jgi:NAD(P)-dependent dehydrogenase (short-subunit alcohol dehydrogenase family)